MTLRATRAEAKTFDARFFERDPRFSAIVPVAKIFADYTDWPTPSEIDEALGARAGIRFVLAKPRPRRQRGPVDVRDMYDARIARGEVPTRERNWHDLLNALVWATFPKSKATLHARQHRAIREWAGADVVRKLPNARTRELDALALVDEGGVIVCDDAKLVVFGHALYEGFVLGVRSMIARAVPVDGSSPDADALLAARLATVTTPEELPRQPLADFIEHTPQ
jgi:hypothetical protein